MCSSFLKTVTSRMELNLRSILLVQLKANEFFEGIFNILFGSKKSEVFLKGKLRLIQRVGN